MEIAFEGQITQQDYLQAQSLHRKLSKPVIVLGNIVLGFIIIALVVSS